MNTKNKIYIALVTATAIVGSVFYSFDFSLAQAVPTANQKTIDMTAYVVSNDKNQDIVNGDYDVRFTIYRVDRAVSDPYPSDTDAGSRLWTETQHLPIQGGKLSAYLGAVTPFPPTLTFGPGEYYLGIRIGTDSEMVPRKKIGAVPQAYNAFFLNGATTGTNAGDIPILGSGGKLSSKMVSVSTPKLKVSGATYLKASGMKLTAGKINLGTDTTGTLDVASLSPGTNGDVLQMQGGVPTWAVGGGGMVAHDLLGAFHSDTTPAVVVRGGLVTGQGAVPTWSQLNPGASGYFLKANGVGADLTWAQITKSDVGLGSVENTALSTWAGSGNITTLGTIGSGTWQGSQIDISSYTNLAVSGTLLKLTGDTLSLGEGTLTDARLCTFDANGGNPRLVCNTTPGSVGASYGAGSGMTLNGSNNFDLGGALTQDATLSGAFNLTLSDANAGFRMRGNDGALYGIFDVDNLTVSNKTYTFPNVSGTVITTGDIGTVTGTMIANDTVQLTTDTNGNYVGNVANGNGLTGGSAGSEGASLTLAVNLLNSLVGTGTTASFSGLEFAGGSNQLTMLQGCGANEVLSWDDINGLWKCNTVGGIGGGSVTSIGPGNGLSSGLGAGGTAPITSSGTLAISLLDTFSGTGVTVSASGMEFNNGKLTMLQGCDDGNVLRFDGANHVWYCSLNVAAATAVINVNGFSNIQEVDFNTLAFNSAPDFTFGMTADVATIGIDYGNSKITRGNQNENITGLWDFQNSSGITLGKNGSPNNTAGTIKFMSAGSSNPYYTTITAGSQSMNLAYILPTDTAPAGWFLRNDGSGSLYWGEAIGGGGGGGSVTQVNSGNGLTGGPINTTGTLSINLLDTLVGTGATSAYSGMEFAGGSNKLTLLQGCSDSQVLIWDDTNNIWKCSDVAGGGGAGGIGGSGDQNYLAKFTAAKTIADSLIYETGGLIGIGRTDPSYTLDITGTFRVLTTAPVFGAYTLTIPGSGTAALRGDNLGVFAATTSAQLAGVISNETGSGALVFGTSPLLTSPTIAKIANLTSDGFVKTINGDGTLSIDGSTYITGNQSITLSGDVTGSGTTSIAATVEGIRGSTVPVLSSGFLKYTGANWSFDNTAYLPAANVSGAQNYLSMFTSSSALGTAPIYISSGSVGIGTTNPLQKLAVNGSFGIASTSAPYYTSFVGTGQTANIAYTLPTNNANGYLQNNGGIWSWAATAAGTSHNLLSSTHSDTSGAGTETQGDLIYRSGANWTNLHGTVSSNYFLGYNTSTSAPQWMSVPTSIGIGTTISSATVGSVFFAGASGILQQDNANFFWDDGNNRLGIGTTAPNNFLEVRGTATPQLRVAYDGSNYYTDSVSSAGAVTLDATGASAGFTLNDPLTMAANAGFTMTSGTGQFSQTYTGSGDAMTITTSSALNGNKALNVSQTGVVGGNAYAVYGSSSGGNSTNIAGYFTATNASNNYSIVVPNAGGYVGIWNPTPSYIVDIATSAANQRGVNILNQGTTGTEYGIYSSVSGAATTNYAGYFSAVGAGTNYGINVAALTGGAGSQIITSAITSTGGIVYGLNLGGISSASNFDRYGIALGSMTGGTSSATTYGIYFAGMSGAGNVYGINLGAMTGGASAGTGNAQFQTGALTIGAGKNYQLNLGGLTGSNNATTGNYGINIGTINSAGTATTNYGLNIGNISGGTTADYAINLGTLTGGAGATTIAQLNTGAVTAVASASNYQLNLGGITGTANSSTNYGINLGDITSSGTSTNNYGINVGNMAGGAAANYGINLGTLGLASVATGASIKTGQITNTGSGTSYGLYLGGLASNAGNNSTNYGIFIDNMTQNGTSVNNYGIKINLVSANSTSSNATGISLGSLSSWGTTYGIDIGGITGLSAVSAVINTSSVNIQGSTNSTNYGINLLSTGNLITGTGNNTTNTGIAIGNINSTGTTTTNYGLKLGTLTGGTTGNYQISTGLITAGSGVQYQLNLGGISGAAPNSSNYGINLGSVATTGASTNNYGLYLNQVAGATNNWSIYGASTAPYYFAGKVGIGTTAPSALFSVGTGATSPFTVDASGNVVTAGTITLPNSNTLTGLSNFLQISGGIEVGGGTTYYINNAGLANLSGLIVAGTANINIAGTQATSIGNTTGPLTLQSGGTSGWTNTSGNLTISTASSGTLALTSVAALNLTGTSIGLAGPTTVSANNNFSLASGTGQFSQTYTGTGIAMSLSGAAASGTAPILYISNNTSSATNGQSSLYIDDNGSSSNMKYGAYVTVRNNAGTGPNIGGYFNAQGAGKNYALITNSGFVGFGVTSPVQQYQFNTSGTTSVVITQTAATLMGIGTTSPLNTLEVRSTSTQLRVAYDVNNYMTVATASNGAVTFDSVSGSAASGFTFSDTVTMTSPKIITNILDTNGNELIDFGALGSAVNNIKISNAATNTAPTIEAFGGDTNISLNVKAKGTGTVNIGDTTGTQAFMIDSSGKVGIGSTAPDTTLKVVGSICAKATDSNCAGTTAGNIYAANFVANGTQLNVPDYVFDSNYNLMSVNDLKDYVNVYQHLPNVPSASQIEKNGLDYNKMILGLLEKTEENTLYMFNNYDQINLLSANVQALSTQNQALVLKTDQNITTLQELQTSVDTQLGVVQSQLLAMNQKLDNDYQRLNSLDSLTASLQAQIDQLKALTSADTLAVKSAQIDANTNDISYLKMLLGMDRTSGAGDINLLGQLEADGVVAGAFTVKVSDADRPTIGQNYIGAPKTDASGNVIDDGKTYFVKTKAVSAESRIFVTPKDLTDQPIVVTSIKAGEGFTVAVKNTLSENLHFDWLIVKEADASAGTPTIPSAPTTPPAPIIPPTTAPPSDTTTAPPLDTTTAPTDTTGTTAP